MNQKFAYHLTLPPRLVEVHDVFHVSMLRKYEPDPAHVLNFEEIEVDERVLYMEHLVRIEDRKEQVLRNKMIPLVKVIWQYHGTEGATWESEDDMMCKYFDIFKDV